MESLAALRERRAYECRLVAGEAEARRWFSWPWYWTDTLIADLIRAGRLRRIDVHLAARLCTLNVT